MRKWKVVHMITTRAGVRWSVEGFAKFWATPDATLVGPMLTPDIKGYWPWTDVPVQGVADYVDRLAKVIAYVPEIRLTVGEHATNGNATFIRWIMHGRGVAGPFELSGIDRLILRDGLVAENVIRFDSGQLRALVGRPPYWQHSQGT
jgi:hypothetical protein